MDKKKLEEIIGILYTHNEGDESRNECDADGLYCRSGCIESAVERLRNKFGN